MVVRRIFFMKNEVYNGTSKDILCEVANIQILPMQDKEEKAWLKLGQVRQWLLTPIKRQTLSYSISYLNP